MTDSTVVIACNVCVHKQIPTAEVRSPWMARGPAKLEKEKALKSVRITMAVDNSTWRLSSCYLLAEDCSNVAADQVWVLYSVQGCKQAVKKLWTMWELTRKLNVLWKTFNNIIPHMKTVWQQRQLYIFNNNIAIWGKAAAHCPVTHNQKTWGEPKQHIY